MAHTCTQNESEGRPSLFSEAKGDFAGGFASGVVAITGNMAFGIVAFAPLGPEFIGQGILAGMFSSIIAGFFASILGGAPGMITGPKIPSALVFAAMLTQLMETGAFDTESQAAMTLLIALAFSAVWISGLIQLLFGLLRMGSVVKFIPYPVLAGIKNATAILIILGQVRHFLGLPGQELVPLWFHANEMNVLAFGVATITFVAAWKLPKYTSAMLAPILSLAIGTILCHGVLLTDSPVSAVPLVGEIPSAFPTPKYGLLFIDVIKNPVFLQSVAIVLPAALAMAILNSLATLMSVVTLQSLSYRRYDANKELIGQGIGNIAGAFFGSISAAGFVSRTSQNYLAGGRTKLSGIINSLTVLLLIAVLTKPIGFIPKAAIAGLVSLIGFQLFDRWSLNLFQDAIRKKKGRGHDLFFNCVIVLLVVVIALLFNVAYAVVVGVMVSVFAFVVEMSKSSIRAVYKGSHFHSKKERYQELAALLETHGQRIAVLELEGMIFFASADHIVNRIDQMVQNGATYFILDFNLVTRIDSTAVQVLKQAVTRYQKTEVVITFSYARSKLNLWNSMNDFGLVRAVPTEHFFEDTDWALEYLEDQLLRQLDAMPVGPANFAIETFMQAHGLKDNEIEILKTYLEKKVYEPGAYVYEQGDKGDSMLFVMGGVADITLRLPGIEREKRVSSLTYGTVCGEMTMLDGKPRSANIRAKETFVCQCLTTARFAELKQQHPAIAMRIYEMISFVLVARLRSAGHLISELETGPYEDKN